jgi:hypothetical protein
MANLVAHCNVRQISTAFHIRAATVKAVRILRACMRIRSSTDLRGTPTARVISKERSLL